MPTSSTSRMARLVADSTEAGGLTCVAHAKGSEAGFASAQEEFYNQVAMDIRVQHSKFWTAAYHLCTSFVPLLLH